MFQQVIAGVADVPNAAKVIFGAHCHNDLGLAVANSLAAIEGGARRVECTINGIGERAGNCSLEEIAMVLKVRQAFYEQDSSINTQRIVAPAPAATPGRHAGTAQQGHRRRQRLRPRIGHPSARHARHRGTYEIMRPEDVGWKTRRWCWAATVGAPLLKRAPARAGLLAGRRRTEAGVRAVQGPVRTAARGHRCRPADADAGRFNAQGYRLASMTISDVGSRANALVELSDPMATAWPRPRRATARSMRCSAHCRPPPACS
jgi:2-isopropylmalate synthase